MQTLYTTMMIVAGLVCEADKLYFLDKCEKIMESYCYHGAKYT
ncbi:MAG: hypothetical protein ACLUR5_05095 [Eubacterium ventriosum]